MNFRKAASIAVLMIPGAFAQSIQFPTSPLTVTGTSSTGVSFVYSGTLTQAATISINQSGLICLQTTAYCTNGAGVVVTAGSTGVGGSSTFTGTFFGSSATWTFGTLLMNISGVGTVQVFPTSAANGLGSGSPPSSLSLPLGTTLSALGFPSFSASSPTITFVVADNLYSDNTGSFSLTQSTAPPSTPAPPSAWLLTIGLAALLATFLLQRRVRIS